MDQSQQETPIPSELKSSDNSLLMVDVDGMLNPNIPSVNHVTYKINGFTVYLNPEHGSWLIDLATRTNSELVWCTYWEANAPKLVAPKVGLPEMPYIPIHVFKMSASVGANKAYSAKKYADGRKFVMLEDEFDVKHFLFGSNGHQVYVDPDTGLQRSHIEQAYNYLVA
jgi:HAD domain in Swiss Army Knife RNA repair proteins